MNEIGGKKQQSVIQFIILLYLKQHLSLETYHFLTKTRRSENTFFTPIIAQVGVFEHIHSYI